MWMIVQHLLCSPLHHLLVRPEDNIHMMNSYRYFPTTNSHHYIRTGLIIEYIEYSVKIDFFFFNYYT
jgi:hypothetical protein